MTDYHRTYKGPEGQTTQWEDIQIKLGNMAPKPKKASSLPYEGAKEAVTDAQWLAGRDEEELSDMEDAFVDDRALESIRYCDLCGQNCRCQMTPDLTSSRSSQADPIPAQYYTGSED